MLCRRRSEVDTRAAFEREWTPASRGGVGWWRPWGPWPNGRQRGATRDTLSVRSERLERANGRRLGRPARRRERASRNAPPSADHGLEFSLKSKLRRCADFLLSSRCNILLDAMDPTSGLPPRETMVPDGLRYVDHQTGKSVG